MPKLDIPYFRIRHNTDGTRRFYWSPSDDLIAAGWNLQRLPDEEILAIAACQKINAELAAWRTAGAAAAPARSVNALIAHYKKSERFKALAINSQRQYLSSFKVIAATFGKRQVSSLTKPEILKFKDSMADEHGKQCAVIRALRLLLTFAVDEGWIRDNPARDPGLEKYQPREAYCTRVQALLLAEGADKMNMPHLRKAVILGFYLNQRPVDTLALNDTHYNAATDSFTIRQQKTGRVVVVPAHPMVKACLGPIAPGATLVTDEPDGKPMCARRFRRQFAALRKAVLPGVDLFFADMRRSATTALALASCTPQEIAAINGWSIRDGVKMIDAYTVITAQLGRQAMDKRRAMEERDDQAALVAAAF